MRIRVFIGECVNGNQTKERTVSSVYFDGDTIYSYGYHYPLLFKIGGKWILNDTGYSSTTAKHISWARYYADGVVKLDNQSRGKPTAEKVRECINSEIIEIKTDLMGLRTGAFRKLERLKSRQAELLNTLGRIKNA